MADLVRVSAPGLSLRYKFIVKLSLFIYISFQLPDLTGQSVQYTTKNKSLLDIKII